MARSSRAADSPRRVARLHAGTRICVLFGAEPMLIHQHLQILRQAMQAEHGEVEILNFDGETAPLADVLDEVRSYGLMQQYKLVVVDQADKFAADHRAVLERYAQSPVDHATLVLRGTKWNSGKLDKLIEKVGCIIKCAPLTAPNASRWIADRAREHHHCKLSPQAADMLVQRLGCDLGRLDSELAKLATLVEDGQAIEREMIESLAGRGSDEDAWAVEQAVYEAIAQGPISDRTVGGRIIHKVHELLALSRQPENLVVYFLANSFRKLNQGMMMRRQGLLDRDIAGTLKLWGDRQRFFFQALQRLKAGLAVELLDQAIGLDARAKSGMGDFVRNMECFCAVLDDKLN